MARPFPLLSTSNHLVIHNWLATPTQRSVDEMRDIEIPEKGRSQSAIYKQIWSKKYDEDERDSAGRLRGHDW